MDLAVADQVIQSIAWIAAVKNMMVVMIDVATSVVAAIESCSDASALKRIPGLRGGGRQWRYVDFSPRRFLEEDVTPFADDIIQFAIWCAITA